MIICPNCSYKLVLVSNRRKYKCAKCSRLYLQKITENKNFQQWNKSQRKLDLHNLKLEKPKPNPKLRKPRLKLSKEKLLRRRKESYRNHYLKNKDKINAKRRQRWKNNEQYNLKRKIRRNKNIELTRLQARIDHWKNQQKLLADRFFRNGFYTACNIKISHSVPSFVLCEQLIK